MDFNTSFILPNGLDLGGVTTWSAGLAERLAGVGRQTTLVRHVDRYTSGDCIIPSGVDLIECAHHIHPNHWYLLKRDIDEYVKSYRQTLPSIIVPNYSFGSYAACACLAVESAEKIRIIGMAHTDNAEYYRWLVRFESIIHIFIAVSSEIAVKLIALLPHRRQDIVCRPCGVSVYDNLSRQYSSPPKPLKLIYAGRLSERQKHVSDLVRLAVMLDVNGVDFELEIYGSGRDQQYLEDLIESLEKDVRNRVRLAGQVGPRTMAALYRSADVFVLVSEYEGTSLSMLESMAQGCVPVVTQVSGTAEVVIDGKNGFTVPVGDICSMAEKILWLDQHRNRMSQLGSAAYATVHDRYSYENYVPWFSDILDGVRQQSPRKWQGGQSFPFHFPVRQFIKEAGYTLAAKPGLRWLYKVREPARKMIQ
ncbi:MAG: glycosyltransferase family 4 protein [Pseudomonadota bacterium]